MAPPTGAAVVSVTVPVLPVPPTTLVGLTVTEDKLAGGGTGLTVSTAERETALKVPVIDSTVEAVTDVVVMEKVALVAPAATVTLAGTVATAVLALLRPTTSPPAGAPAVNVPVPCDELTPTTVVGVTLTEDELFVGGRVRPPACGGTSGAAPEGQAGRRSRAAELGRDGDWRVRRHGRRRHRETGGALAREHRGDRLGSSDQVAGRERHCHAASRRRTAQEDGAGNAVAAGHAGRSERHRRQERRRVRIRPQVDELRPRDAACGRVHLDGRSDEHGARRDREAGRAVSRGYGDRGRHLNDRRITAGHRHRTASGRRQHDSRDGPAHRRAADHADRAADAEREENGSARRARIDLEQLGRHGARRAVARLNEDIARRVHLRRRDREIGAEAARGHDHARREAWWRDHLPLHAAAHLNSRASGWRGRGERHGTRRAATTANLR